MTEPNSPERELLLSNDELSRLHSVQLAMLRHFDRICQSLAINYQICGGTLLGAIRHRGFIPWDDDVDVFMSRNDFEIFLEGAPPLLDKRYFLQHRESDPGYVLQFAKLRHVFSEFRECRPMGMPRHPTQEILNHGIYIDIFPLDSVEPGKWWGELHLTWMRWLKACELLANHRDHGVLSPKRNILVRTGGRIAYILLNIVPFSARDYLMYKSMTLLRERRTSYLACLATMSHDLKRARELIRPKSELTDTIPVAFENIWVLAPRDFHRTLTRAYGDYMQLPCLEDRIPKHKVSSFTLPSEVAGSVKHD